MSPNAQLLAEAQKALDAWFAKADLSLPACAHEAAEWVGTDPDGLNVHWCPEPHCQLVWKDQS